MLDDRSFSRQSFSADFFPPLAGHHRACPERTYMIPADDRRFDVVDDRRFVVPPDDRRYTVKGC
jgi:hypothetical protein